MPETSSEGQPWTIYKADVPAYGLEALVSTWFEYVRIGGRRGEEVAVEMVVRTNGPQYEVLISAAVVEG